MKQLITGHYKNLSKEEWLESAASFIKDARRCIRRAKQGIFGRDYCLYQAEEKIALAEECIEHATE